MNMQQVLEITGLEKRFGSCQALRGVDMSIPMGQIVGLLGPNASGKTTLLKTAAGLLQPSAGRIHYSGNAEPGPEARKTISFCPDTMDFPHWMCVSEAFTFYSEMYGDYSEARKVELMRTLERKSAE